MCKMCCYADLLSFLDLHSINTASVRFGIMCKCCVHGHGTSRFPCAGPKCTWHVLAHARNRWPGSRICMCVKQYTYVKLRGRLRAASGTSPEVAAVVAWRTDYGARNRIALDPIKHVTAAIAALGDAEPDEAFELLMPCFQASLGPMRLRMTVHECYAKNAAAMSPSQALAGLITLCESRNALPAELLAPYKKVLGL